MITYKEFEETYLNVGVKEAVEQLFISKMDSTSGLGDTRMVEIANRILQKTPFKISTAITIRKCADDDTYFCVLVKHNLITKKGEICLEEFKQYVKIQAVKGDDDLNIIYNSVIYMYNLMQKNVSNSVLYGSSTFDDFFDAQGKPIVSIYPLDAAIALKHEFDSRNRCDRSILDCMIVEYVTKELKKASL